MVNTSQPENSSDANASRKCEGGGSVRAQVPGKARDTGGERFRRRHRLRTSADFQRVYDAKRRAGDDVLLIFALPNELGHSRLGLSVSRKVGNAVKRGRWKRLIREAFRRNRAEIPGNLDLIVIPRPGVTPEYAAVRDSLIQLSRRLARKNAARQHSGGTHRGKGAGQ